MTPLQAINVAKKYYDHVEKRRTAKHNGDNKLAKFHEGCMQMALQIFEEFTVTHKFGSPNHALQCEEAILRSLRLVPSPDDIPQYYNCKVCDQNTVVCRPKMKGLTPMVHTVCTGCGELINEEER